MRQTDLFPVSAFCPLLLDCNAWTNTYVVQFSLLASQVWSRECVVGLWAGWSGVRFWTVRETFLSSQCWRWVGSCFTWVKQPGCGTDHLPLTSTEARNGEGALLLLPCMSLWRVGWFFPCAVLMWLFEPLWQRSSNACARSCWYSREIPSFFRTHRWSAP